MSIRTEPGNETNNPALDQLRYLNIELQALTDLGCFQEAEHLCEKLIADFPEKANGFVGLTRISFKQQNHSLTLQHCEQFLQRFPEELALLNFKAESLTALERFEESKPICRKLMDIYPNKANGYVGLTRIAFKQKNYPLTLEYCDCYIPRFPEELPLLNLKAESLIALGQFEEAEKLCQSITTNYPDNPAGFVYLTRIALKQHDYSLAINRCGHYLKHFPDDFFLLCFKAEALLALSSLEESERIAHILATRYPNKPAVLTLLARLSFAKEQFQATLELCYQLLEQFPNEINVINLLANALIALSRTEEANQLFQQTVLNQPGQPVGYLGVARIASIRGQFDDVIRLCDNTIERFPRELESHTLKSNALISLSRWDEARKLFETLVNDYPSRSNGYFGLFQLYRKLEKHQPALDAVKKAYALNLRSTFITTQYATQLELMGKREEAFALLEHHVHGLNHDMCIVPLVNLYSKYNETSKILELLETKKEIFSRIDKLQIKAGYALRNKGDLMASCLLFMNPLDSNDSPTLDEIKNKYKAHEQIKLFHGIVENHTLFKHPFFASCDLPKPALFNDHRYNEIITLMESKEFAKCGSLLADLLITEPKSLIVGFIQRVVEYAQTIDSMSSKYAESYLDTGISPSSAITLSQILVNRIQRKIPTSMIRLGDGEGMFLRYPDQYKKWQKNDKEHSQRIWWGGIKFSEYDNNSITSLFFDAVRNADILGIPNLAIMIQSTANVEGIPQNPTHRGWRAIHHHIATKEFLDSKLSTAILTSWHCHNDLEFWGLYRYILTNLQTVTVISCHAGIGQAIQDKFGIRSVKAIAIPSEHRHSHHFKTHNDDNDHYPNYFENILKTLAVETGDVFLVAAGFLGKIYCNEIKKKGGIGIDIGSVADVWMGYSTRDEHEYTHRIRGVNIDTDLLRQASFPGYRKVEKQRYYRSNYDCDMNIFRKGDEIAATAKVKHKKILITGHPRCGSSYMSLVFGRLGVDINHEMFGNDGICSWLFAVRDLNMPIFNKQTIEPYASYYTEFDYTLAYVRNPFAAIPSIIIENRGERSYNFRRNHIINALGIDIDDYQSALERAVASYLYWNKIVQLKNPILTFKVEDCIEDVAAFLYDKKLINQTIDTSDLDIPTNANSTISFGFTKPEILPSDYSKIDGHLKSELLSFCKHYGYETQSLL